jgi:excinuclease ABC subunit C
MPTTPGVYIYKNQQGQVIYVGKAKNLKNRVSSYFKSPVQLGPKTAQLVQNIATLEHIDVNSEIEALLLESRLIRKFKPFYNLISKDDKSPFYIHITKENFPKPIINHQPTRAIAGPFLNGLIPRKILKSLRPIAPYCSSSQPTQKPCFYFHLNLCNPCPGSNLNSDQIIQYQKNINRLKRLISGHFASVKSGLLTSMREAANKQNYSQAAMFRDQILALDHLLITPVSPDNYLVNPNLISDQHQKATEDLSQILSPYYPNLKLHRIEMYDNAHLSGTHATSAMTVAIDGNLNSQHYRHFKIKSTSTPNDVDMMAEVLARRLKNTDWPTPDLLVLDGGIPQLSKVISTTPIPLIALSKRLETIIVPHAGTYQEINLPANHSGLLLLQHLRDEAHRFSRRLHHQLRGKIIA